MHLPILSLRYGLKRQDIYGDATHPGLHVDELQLYLEHLKRLIAEEEGRRG